MGRHSSISDRTAESIEARDDGLEVKLSARQTLYPDTVLFAAGRIANTEGLGLDAAGISCDSRGRIHVDGNFRTTADGIYAAGDVLGPTLASIAMEQGRAAVCHAFGIPFEGTVDPAPVSAVYGMPEVSGAGLTEEQCREQGLDYEVGRADLGCTPRGAIAGRGGLLKLIFQREEPDAAWSSLHRRHRLGDCRDRPDGHPVRRHAEHDCKHVDEHADLCVRLQVRGVRRVAPHRGSRKGVAR